MPAGYTIKLHFMTEEKQTNPEGKQVSNGTGKKINRDTLKWVVIGLAGFAVVVLIFGAGMVVGGMKAKFSCRWAESYHKNFGGPEGGFFGDWRRMPPLPGDFIEGHGAFGKIIELRDNGFVIRGRGNVEKMIVITQDTVIKKRGEDIKKDKLKVDDYAVIIGSPNKKGQIEAKFIRVFNGKLRRLPMPHKGRRLPFF